ncbi:MAG TPA: hypothetical protein DD706_02090 [Nitrospiraceae bacterium]|nr:hypothetical protein [Nitrospiraceae bacterium]
MTGMVEHEPMNRTEESLLATTVLKNRSHGMKAHGDEHVPGHFLQSYHAECRGADLMLDIGGIEKSCFEFGLRGRPACVGVALRPRAEGI